MSVALAALLAAVIAPSVTADEPAINAASLSSSSEPALTTLSHPAVQAVELGVHSGREALVNMMVKSYSLSNHAAYNTTTMLSVVDPATGHRSQIETRIYSVPNSVMQPMSGCPMDVFYVTATVGGQTVNLLVDTGSTTLAVADTTCGSSCNTNHVYNPANSPFSVNTQQSTSGWYGSGNVGWTGTIYQDYVQIASVPLTQMKFVGIDHQQSFFNSANCISTSTAASDGIIGMAYPAIASSGTDNYFTNLISQHSTLPNVFALQVCTNSGKLWLGGYDSSYITGPIQYTPIINQAWYVVGINSMTIGSTTIGTGSAFGQTIVDSGTTQLTLPSGVYNSLVSALQSNAYWNAHFPSGFWNPSTLQCVYLSGITPATLNANLPKLTVNLNGASLSLNAASSYIMVIQQSGYTYYCPGVGEFSYTILGFSVMNQFTTIFDRANNRIGFAPTNYCGSNAPKTYSWAPSAWGTCSAKHCGWIGSQTRTYACQDSTNNVVPNSYCSGAAPSTSQVCSFAC